MGRLLNSNATSKIKGSFSIDDGNGSENVSFKKNSRFFNLCRVYSNLLKMASVGEFPTGVDFLRTALKFGERKRDYYDKF